MNAKKPSGMPVSYVAVALLVALSASNAYAYIGPGAGLTAIGSFIALIAACIVALIGFVWYPLKRLVRKLRGQQQSAAPQDIA